MKFLKTVKGRFQFRIDRLEKELLFQLIARYPLIPVAYHRASIGEKADKLDATQKLLMESLEEQRRENRRQIEAMLKAKGRFKPDAGGYRFSLTCGEMQWLLQVLNDLRVGSWLALGQPDEQQSRRLEITGDNAPFLWAMETCGAFEMVLLRAFEAGNAERHEP